MAAIESLAKQKENPMDKAWISTKEACDYLDITWATLKK